MDNGIMEDVDWLEDECMPVAETLDRFSRLRKANSAQLELLLAART